MKVCGPISIKPLSVENIYALRMDQYRVASRFATDPLEKLTFFLYLEFIDI